MRRSASLQAMIDYAKANPGKLSIGHAGVGSMAHITLELLQQKAGIVLTGVPYKGGAPMVTDLLGGHIPLSSDLLSNFVQLAADKKVRLLAVASARRMSNLPDVPAVQELLHAPFEATAWFIVMAPAGTPADIVQKVNAVTNRYLQSAAGKDLDRPSVRRGWRRHAGGGCGVREARARKVGAGDQGGEHFAELGRLLIKNTPAHALCVRYYPKSRHPAGAFRYPLGALTGHAAGGRRHVPLASIFTSLRSVSDPCTLRLRDRDEAVRVIGRRIHVLQATILLEHVQRLLPGFGVGPVHRLAGFD